MILSVRTWTGYVARRISISFHAKGFIEYVNAFEWKYDANVRQSG